MREPRLPMSTFSYADAQRLGITDRLLRRLVRDGRVIKLRPNTYIDATAAGLQSPTALYLAEARAVAAQLDGNYVLAQETAAVVHGLRTPRRFAGAPARICLYTEDSRNSCTRNGVHVSVSPLHPGDTVIVDGTRVTSIARTSIDLARGNSLPASLIALDSALALGVEPAALTDVARRMKQWRGTKILRSAIPLADARSESALESAARGACLAAGLPAPDLQVALIGASGRRYRVDMVWTSARLILEPDGIQKYGDTDSERRRNFEREKDREDDLRAADYRIIRVTWNTLPERVALIAAHLRKRTAR